ncbi:MAG: Cobalt-precorrin-7 (C5)-methyltransferase [Firmicutes bacterium]|nr:Cobalt-precorrin-7 (C5)-methyltransferase [Bacillota bacterium]MDI6705598.1 precorrin-6y C5,15-methyltransferase (decarboxylating) subunit CbiE [Bacillota bacterium]
MKNNRIYIVGIGPGSADLVTPCAMKVIEGCDVLIGGRRNLAIFRHLMKEEVPIGGRLQAVCTYIRENMAQKDIAVLVTGDPGIFSISDYLKRCLPDADLEVIPGISSLQYLCGRMGVSWNDMAVLSLHGREDPGVHEAVKHNKKTAIFTGGGTSPADVCKRFIDYGIHDVSITVGERLSYSEERIVSGGPDEIAKMSFDSLSIMIVQRKKEEEPPETWKYKSPGIPDSLFIRGSVPMTKEEVRAAAISKLRLKEDSVVYDIGAGTGSVTVECGLICRKGRVCAIEREREAVALINENLKRFGLQNVTVVEGQAPAALKALTPPDRVFIGGTGGQMDGILDWVSTIPGAVRVVVNAIAPESAYEALKGFEKYGFVDIEMVGMNVSKGVKAGDRHIMKALNPVYIISAGKGGVI